MGARNYGCSHGGCNKPVRAIIMGIRYCRDHGINTYRKQIEGFERQLVQQRDDDVRSYLRREIKETKGLIHKLTSGADLTYEITEPTVELLPETPLEPNTETTLQPTPTANKEAETNFHERLDRIFHPERYSDSSLK